MQIENMAPSPSEKREMSKKRENINRLNVIEEKVINESHSVHLSAPGSSVTWTALITATQLIQFVRLNNSNSL